MNAQTLHNRFDMKRFLYLFRFELYAGYKSLIIILATSIGIVTLVNLTSIPAAGLFAFHEIFYPLVLMIGGLIFSGQAFSSLHKPGNDLRYVTLPASTLEKTAAKIFLTSLFYIIVSAVAYFIATTIMEGLTFLVFGRAHALFNPFSSTNLLNMGIYLVVQSIFVFGSVYFKRMALAKTVLSLLAIIMMLSIFSGLVFALINIDTIIANGFWGFRSYSGTWTPPFVTLILGTVPGVIFWGLLAPLFWTLSYFRLKEKEV